MKINCAKSFQSCCFANTNSASAKKYRSFAKQVPQVPKNLAQGAIADIADQLAHCPPLQIVEYMFHAVGHSRTIFSET